METTTATRRGIVIGLVIAMLGLLLWQAVDDRADAAVPQALPAAAFLQTGDEPPTPAFGGYWFARYDGIDGESQDANHDKWIDVLSIDWGSHKPGGGATGQSRRRGGAIVEDFVITFDYEKASPKILEACLEGKVIPKLEVELTATFGGARATYLKYEMKNVSCTTYDVGGSAGEGPPTVVVGNNFEEIKVTYTEYDDTGSKLGDIVTQWKVERGN
jgi:type VI secretion system secreted protein Hcp